MNTKIEILDKQNHANLRKKYSHDYQHVKTEQMSPVNMHEFADAGTCFPLLFVKHSSNAKFFPIALFGFEKGENVFYAKDKWQCTYVPSAIRRDPFSLKPTTTADGSVQWKISVDLNSENISDSEGEPLFQDDYPSPFLEAIHKELINDIKEQAVTAEFVKYLEENKLLSAIKFNLTCANNQVKQVNGIYAIDEPALKTLTTDKVQEAHSKGYFKAIYCMIGSRHNLYELIKRQQNSSKDVITHLTIIDNQHQFMA